MEGTKDIPGLTFKKKMYMEFWIKKVLKKFYTMLVWYLLVVWSHNYSGTYLYVLSLYRSFLGHKVQIEFFIAGILWVNYSLLLIYDSFL